MVQLPAETLPHTEGSHSRFCKINFAIPASLKRNRRHHQPGKEHRSKTQPAKGLLQDIVSSLYDRWQVTRGTKKNNSHAKHFIQKRKSATRKQKLTKPKH